MGQIGYICLAKFESFIYILFLVFMYPFKLISFFIFISLGSLVVFSGCDVDRKREKPSLDSKGEFAEVLLVMDTNQWRGELGESLKMLFQEDMPGLPQDEPWFKVLLIPPNAFKSFLQRHHNVIIVATTDNQTSVGSQMRGLLTEDVRRKMKQESSLAFSVYADMFAKGQKVLIIGGSTEAKLAAQINANKLTLRNLFLNSERLRMQNKLFAAGEQTKLSDFMLRKHKLKLRVPAGYDVAKDERKFIWIRNMEEPADRSIYITYLPYTNEKMFDIENIIALRDSIGYVHLNDTTLRDSYMSTERLVMPVENRMTVDGEFLAEYRGLWKLKNSSRGGAFISYAFVDKKLKRMYYIEAFLYAPSTQKRKYILELESILRTFKRSDGA